MGAPGRGDPFYSCKSWYLSSNLKEEGQVGVAENPSERAQSEQVSAVMSQDGGIWGRQATQQAWT